MGFSIWKMGMTYRTSPSTMNPKLNVVRIVIMFFVIPIKMTGARIIIFSLTAIPVVQSLLAYLTKTDLVKIRQLRIPSCHHESDYLSIYLSIYRSIYLQCVPQYWIHFVFCNFLGFWTDLFSTALEICFMIATKILKIDLKIA